VATDDDLIFPAGEHRLDKPELPQAPLQGVELIVADPSELGRIRPELVEGNLLDGENGAEGDGHALRSPTSSERGVSLTMRN
jgi:hypothetical protein